MCRLFVNFCAKFFNMKKILAVMFFSLMWNNVSYSSDWNTKINETISNEFKINKKMSFPLDDGDWILIDRSDEYVGWGIGVQELTFVQIENNIAVKVFDIGRATGLSKWQAYLTNIIEAAVFHSKEEGCRERQHYNYLNVYKRGNAHNCMTVRILDVQRVLNPSDYDSDAVFTLGIRNAIKKNNIEMPKIYLWYEASYISMTVRDQWYVMGYGVSAEKFANYKPQFSSRDTTEFHPDKINNFPKAKKIMTNWIEFVARKQKSWEDFLKVKEYQKLDLSSIVQDTPLKYIKRKSKNNITDQLTQLNKLYKSGVLTKEEFQKAKKKILN